jgi:hypothetical protein
MVDSDGNGKSSASSSSRRNFLKVGAGVIAGAAVATASVVQIPFVGADTSRDSSVQSLQAELSSTQSLLSSAKTQVSSLTGQLSAAHAQSSRLQTQSTGLQTELDTMSGFLTLSITEATLVESIVETLIPSDSNGPGAKEAGAIYFIDRQLASDYGKSAYTYARGPFIRANQTSPLTVDGITYSAGSAPSVVTGTTNYQYGMLLRDFWRYGLQAIENYSTSAYGGNFETLSSQNQVQVLTDLYNNKPTAFNDIVPNDLFYELFFMAWSGFLMDPLYGGNRNMVGWQYVAFNGVNTGNFYNEGLTTKQLMVATTPTRLQPASLAQLQQQAGMGGDVSTTSTSTSSSTSTATSSSTSSNSSTTASANTSVTSSENA